MREQERNLRILSCTFLVAFGLAIGFVCWWLYEGVGYWWDEMSYSSSYGPRQGWVPLPAGTVPRTPPPAILGPGETGSALYFNNCRFCHAADGGGDTPVGQEYVPRPPDLRASAAALTAAQLYAAVADGMTVAGIDTTPPLGPRWHEFSQYLSPPELRAVTAYVRAEYGRNPSAGRPTP